MANDFLHAHALGYGRVEDAGAAFADEIDRVARQLVVFHFEQQQRVRFAGRVEAFRGFERMTQFEWPLGGRNDDEIGHIGVARPCGGVALRIGVQHGHVAVVPCGRGGQRHGGGGFAAAALEVDDRDDHEGSSASTINLYKTYILFIYWIDDSHADGVTALAM